MDQQMNSPVTRREVLKSASTAVIAPFILQGAQAGLKSQCLRSGHWRLGR